MVIFDAKKIYDSTLSSKENTKNLKKEVRKNEREIETLQDRIKRRKEKEEKRRLDVQNAFGVGTKQETNSLKQGKAKTIQIDVSMQMELLSYSKEIEELTVFMPQKEDVDYENIINAMLFEIRKQMIVYELEIRKAKFDKKGSQAEIINSIKKLNRMQELISDYKEEQNDKDLSDEIIAIPKILYTRTLAGNICLLNDLKNINQERYPEFLTLFESIVSGNLKKPKTIDHSDGKFTNSITQIRLNHSRMTFHVIQNNCIALSGAFTKHAQKSSVLNSKLKSIDRTFSTQKKDLLEHSKDPIFLKEEEKVTQQVYKILRKER